MLLKGPPCLHTSGHPQCVYAFLPRSTYPGKATSHGSRTLQSFGVPLGKTQRKPNFGESSRRTTLAQGTFSSKLVSLALCSSRPDISSRRYKVFVRISCQSIFWFIPFLAAMVLTRSPQPRGFEVSEGADWTTKVDAIVDFIWHRQRLLRVFMLRAKKSVGFARKLGEDHSKFVASRWLNGTCRIGSTNTLI